MNLVTQTRQVGVLLATRRKHLGLTQATTASRLGLSQNRLSELESYPETLTVAQLLALLHVLGLEMQIGERSGGKQTRDV